MITLVWFADGKIFPSHLEARLVLKTVEEASQENDAEAWRKVNGFGLVSEK